MLECSLVYDDRRKHVNALNVSRFVVLGLGLGLGPRRINIVCLGMLRRMQGRYRDEGRS